MDVDVARKLTQRIYTRLNNRRPDIERAESYYEGDQPLNFATDEWKKANASRYADFSDNWCGTVVNAEAERLKPIGVTNLPKTAAKKLWDALQMNEFDAQFSQGAVTALTAKRCFVIVWGDADDNPIVTFEHPSSVEIEYDWENPRLRTAALKTWVDEDDEFATLYTADEVFKWIRPRVTPADELESMSEQQRQEFAASGGWQERQGTGDDSWPIDNPLGVVPVVEIQNRPTLKGDPLSEIQGVMPMQDAINLLWAYLFLAADYASMDARVMLGTQPPMIPILDDDGKPIGSRPVDMKDLRERRLITITGDNAKIDSWKAAQLNIFTETIEIAVGHIAAQTRTPPHYLVANKGISNLSGDALKSAEIGLNKKAGEFITFTDPQLREVLRLVALVKGDKKTAEATRLAKIVWESPEIRSEAQLADALVKKAQMGYPFEYLLELDGRSPAEISRIMKLRQKELDAALGAGVQLAVQGAIDDGSDEVGE